MQVKSLFQNEKNEEEKEQDTCEGSNEVSTADNAANAPSTATVASHGNAGWVSNNLYCLLCVLSKIC